MTRRGRWAGALAPLFGAALLAAHAAALPRLIDWAERPELVVRVRAPWRAGDGVLAVDGALPAELAGRATVAIDGEVRGGAGDLPEIARTAAGGAPHAPGMHRIEWRVAYRGGALRRVGWTQLSGPYQDVARPPCSVRVLFGQALIDDGAAGPGTLAHLVRSLIERELAGFDRWPVGRFVGVSAIELAWDGGEEAAAGGEARSGHLRASIEVELSRATLGLTLRLTPRVEGSELRFSATTRARVAMASRVAQWVVDLIDGDEIVAELADREIAGALDRLLTAPPPLELGGGREVELVLCDGRQVEVVSDRHAALWLAVRLDRAAAAGARAGRDAAPVLLPPALAAGGAAAHAPSAPVAIELDGNALNGLLHVLWATGFLEEALAAEGIADRFNDDPLVAELLTVRARGPTLPLPPTVAAGRRPGQSYELGVASAFTIEDGPLRTPAHLFGRAGFAIAGGLDVDISLDELGLTCEPEPGLLEPCYAELAAQLIARAPELHGHLSEWFSRMLAGLLVGRDLGSPGGGGSFHIDRTEVRAPPAGRHGPLRLELHGRIVPE